MAKKFNPNIYNGKDRVYAAVLGAPNVTKLWIWDPQNNRYEPPARGKCFEARRTAASGRTKRSFDSLAEAREWLRSGIAPTEAAVAAPVALPSDIVFSALIDEWKDRMFPGLAPSTRIAYEKIVRLYMGPLLSLTVHELTPAQIDSWLDGLKAPYSPAMKSARRKSFDHELSLLATILKYYVAYHDDVKFQFPVKQRHREAIRLNRRSIPKPRDLTLEEFSLFRDRLSAGPYGAALAAMATVQFHQALRVSEVAGLHWNDVKLDLANPEQSRLQVVRSVYWPRVKGMQSSVEAGFKNGDSNKGLKEQPVFPESFEVLVSLGSVDRSGLIFESDGTHFEYRQIQHAYDKAFRGAGLPYRGTHVMRHAGCRLVYNASGGDMEVAKQHLGNTSTQSASVYAKRDARALTMVSDKRWVAHKAGRKRPQIDQAG